MITHEDIAKNNTEGGLWVVLNNKVLDLGVFQFQHPGGRCVLHQIPTGQDASEAFLRAGHDRHAESILRKLEVGVLESSQNRQPVGLHHPLSWRELLVFIITFAGTAVTFLSYFFLLCNRNSGLPFTRAGSGLSTIQELMVEIFSTIYLPTQILLACGFAADFLLVKECRQNFVRLRKAGYSVPYIFFCVSFIFFFSGPTLGVILWNHLQDSAPHFDLGLVLRVGTILVISEVSFTKIHRWMHREKPQFHVMHHCCQYSTVTTSLIFDPEDYLLEFWASKFPILLVLGTDLLGCYDGFACVVALGAAILNDLCNHDAWLRTGHYYHHLDVSVSYGLLHLPWLPSKADPLDRLHKQLDDIFTPQRPTSSSISRVKTSK